MGKGDYAAVLIFHPGFEDSVNTGKEMPVESLYDQARGLSTLIILIMSAIGGSMIPLFLMPAIMKKIAVFSVNYWGIQENSDFVAVDEIEHSIGVSISETAVDYV